MTSERLKSIAEQLLSIANTIDEKKIGQGETNISLDDVICSIGATKSRIEILLEHLNFGK
jgi:hypothetical protein